MILGLDGLRALAFLAVFLFHARYLPAGWSGVQLFFVLSGFLITRILLEMKEKFSIRDYFVKFYGRRFLRIFPLYYSYLGFMSVVATWMISSNIWTFWMQTFLDQRKFAVYYIYDFYAATRFQSDSYLLTHFWSLAVEEQFYILWPLLILLTPKKWLKSLFISFIILGPILRLATLFIHNSGELRMLADSPARVVYSLPWSHIDAFALGAYISCFSLPRAKQQFFILLPLIPLLGFGIPLLTGSEQPSFWSFGFPLHMPDDYKFIWGYSLLNYIFALLIYLVVNQNFLVRFREWGPMRYLGKISYGLYVYHLVLYWAATDIRGRGIVNPPFTEPVITIVSFTATLLISSISYYFLEKPILRLKDQFFLRE